MYDNDPQYQKLKAIRDSGYTGPVDQDGDPARIVGKGRNARIEKQREAIHAYDQRKRWSELIKPRRDQG